MLLRQLQIKQNEWEKMGVEQKGLFCFFCLCCSPDQQQILGLEIESLQKIMFHCVDSFFWEGGMDTLDLFEPFFVSYCETIATRLGSQRDRTLQNFVWMTPVKPHGRVSRLRSLTSL